MRIAQLACLSLLITAQAHAASDLEFVIDLSGSMNKQDQGEAQIESARRAFKQALEKIPAETHVGLRLYGHRIEQANKAESCKDSELVVPIKAMDRAALIRAVEAPTPKGYTPIAHSLELAAQDFATEREAEKTIILLSDGEETCDGDPVAVMQSLKDKGFRLTVHVIGFNVDAKTRAQLEGIASVTGGKYFAARGASGLSQALEAATETSVVIEKQKTTYGNAIRGGDSYETAQPIKLDQELKLDHHQKAKEYDYFFLDLKKGQELKLRLQTLEKGISIRDDGVQENDNPYAGVELHGADRNHLKTLTVIGTRHGLQENIVFIKEDGRYYILVGTGYSGMHKDHSTFTLSVTSRGDLGSEQDAGEDMGGALPIELKRYEGNYLGDADREDMYRFSARQGDQLFVGIIPAAEFDTYFTIRITDDYKQPVFSASSSSNAGIKSNPFTIPADGTYYLKIGLGGSGGKPVDYTFELMPAVVAKPIMKTTE